MEAEILTILKTVGPSAGVYVIFIVGLWKGARWLANNVASPLVEAHKQFLSDIASSTKTNSESQRRVADTLERIEETQSHVVSLLERRPNT